MIIPDRPFVSDIMLNSAAKFDIPLVYTSTAREMGIDRTANVIDEAEAIKLLNAQEYPKVYTNSENSIGWVAKNLKDTKLPELIDNFKNKVRFRELLKPMFPHFYFLEIPFEELNNTDPATLKYPFIIKPATGFFSMGVHRVEDPSQWNNTVAKIEAELKEVAGLYPDEVMNSEAFIIEECIDGEEYAVDVYYDESGEPVVLNIHKHIFSSADDVSDRVYISSKDVILDNLEPFTHFMAEIGKLSGARNITVHAELRRDGEIIAPIEINPMRFGGWCTTADATILSYGFSPYEYFHKGLKPDWEQVFNGKEDKLYGMIVLDNSTGMRGADIESFNYESLLSKFKNPLEMRMIDHKRFPLFGFLFTETDKDDIAELHGILHSDLREFIIPAKEKQGAL